MEEKKIHGNVAGIRDTILQEMQSLYDEAQPTGVFASTALLEKLADYTERIGREISVYLSRSGAVKDVSVGDASTVSMPDMRLVRNADRLAGVRCIHTHPNGSGYLSDVDLGTLNSMRLDAMAAVGVREGKPTSVYVAFVGEMEDEERKPVIYGPMRADRLPQDALLNALIEADNRLKAPAYAVTQAEPERAVLVGIDNDDGYDTLEELKALADTAGVNVVHIERQRKRPIDNGTYVGSGKADELRLIGSATEADVFIFDDELTAIQIRNLESILGAPVIDRTMLILELSQLKYRLPRLLGVGVAMSRQGASGVGMRGPGEKKLEIDRRRIRRRIYELEQELKEVEKQRGIRRAVRKKSETPIAALVGYTNAGKSTLLNVLSDSDVLAEDKLFATLDPVVRSITLPNGTPCLLSDTVGFINKLPHDLVQAFRSTLEEVRDADLILHIVDASCPYYEVQMRVTQQVLESLGAGNTPCIEVYNKCDLPEAIPSKREKAVAISARTGMGIPTLLERIETELNRTQRRVELVIPYDRYEAIRVLHEIGTVLSESHEADGTHVTAMLEESKLYRLKNVLDGRSDE